jgi:hypothetical protein
VIAEIHGELHELVGFGNVLDPFDRPDPDFKALQHFA